MVFGAIDPIKLCLQITFHYHLFGCALADRFGGSHVDEKQHQIAFCHLICSN